MVKAKMQLPIFNVTVLVTLALSSGVLQPCQNSFVSVGANCYYVNSVDKVNWFQAERICHRLHAELLSISDASERQALSEHLESLNVGLEWINSFWTAGTELGEEHNFYWQSTGERLPQSNGLWHAGEPSRSPNEHCVAIYSKGLGSYLNDAPCDIRFWYICRAPQLVITHRC